MNISLETALSIRRAFRSTESNACKTSKAFAQILAMESQHSANTIHAACFFSYALTQIGASIQTTPKSSVNTHQGERAIREIADHSPQPKLLQLDLRPYFTTDSLMI
jgi:hypothetical protein